MTTDCLPPMKDMALRYARCGYSIFPLHHPTKVGCSCGKPECGHTGKHPRTRNGYKDASDDCKQIVEWWGRYPTANIGLVTGTHANVFVLDIDGRAGRSALSHLGFKLDEFPNMSIVQTGRGHHLYFELQGRQIRNTAAYLGAGLDVRDNGGYVVAGGSLHASGQRYTIIEPHGRHGVMTPTVAPEGLMRLIQPVLSTTAGAGANVTTGADANYGQAALQAEAALVHGTIEGSRNDQLNRSSFKLGQLVTTGHLSEGEVIAALQIAARASGLGEVEILRSIISGLSAGMQEPRQVILRGATPPAVQQEDSHAPTLAKFGQTDADNAQRLIHRHGDDLLWTPGGDWYLFEGRYWKPDNERKRYLLAEATARAISAEAPLCGDAPGRQRFAQTSLTKTAIDRMLSVAQNHVAVSDDVLDANHMRLCVRNGTLDLKTGALTAHEREDHITKMLPIEYRAGATCPRFEAFLNTALGNDSELVRHVQKAAGMSLTGDISEQKFFLCHGPGSTGKSTFLNVLRDMLGDYGKHSEMDQWTIRKMQPSIGTAQARLRGARMVTAIEANSDQRFDEAKIKSVTGGEPIVARGLYKNEIQFVPQFKFWFAVNDLPGARSTSDAFWRRAMVIPFKVQVPEAEKDRNLVRKFKEEEAGILAWALRGCLAWQNDGFLTPPAVGEATGVWKAKVDHLTTFIRDRIIREAGQATPAGFMFQDYTDWCEKHGEKAHTIKSFKTRCSNSILSTESALAVRYGLASGCVTIRRTRAQGAVRPLAPTSHDRCDTIFYPLCRQKGWKYIVQIAVTPVTAISRK